MTLVSTVYRSPRREGMYLYVEETEALQRVPEALLKRFGAPQFAMTVTLTPERKLARAEVTDVIAAIRTQGFYLQMPPVDLSQASAGGKAK